MGEPSHPSSGDKPVSVEGTEEDESEQSLNDSTPVVKEKSRDLKHDEESESKLMSETEIKQEIISSDEAGSEYTSDDDDASDADDAERLVIDESVTTKSNKKQTNSSKVTTTKADTKSEVAKAKKVETKVISKQSGTDVKKSGTTKTNQETSKPLKESDKAVAKTPAPTKKPVPDKGTKNISSSEKNQTDPKSRSKKSFSEALSSDKTPSKSVKKIPAKSSKEDKISKTDKIKPKSICDESSSISDKKNSKSTFEKKKTDQSSLEFKNASEKSVAATSNLSTDKKNEKSNAEEAENAASENAITSKQPIVKVVALKFSNSTLDDKEKSDKNISPVKDKPGYTKKSSTKLSPTEKSTKIPKTSNASVAVKTENNLWTIPFEEGWKRELVLRGTSDPSRRKRPADVYYFAPCGTKLRSMPEILAYLNEHDDGGLGLSNFTFMKEQIYHPPEEQTRQAAQRSLITPKTTPRMKKPVKVKITTPSSVSASTPASASTSATSFSPPPLAIAEGPPATPTSPLTSPDGQPVLGAKRWRKRKALPPDFLHTEQALSQRAPKEAYRVQLVARPPKPTTSNTAVTSTPISNSQDAKVTSGVGLVKRKILVSTDLMGNLSLSKKPRMMLNSSKGATPEICSSGSINSNSPSKVMFTFSRMGTGPITQNNNSMYTLVRVNPLQTPCTLSCPGLQGQVPDLHCTVCLLLFHSQCVGTSKDFVCQRCKKQKNDLVKLAPKSDMNSTPTLTNGDATHKNEDSDQIEIQTPPDEDEVVITNGDAPVEEELEDADLASDDDDDNFLTVTPEVVMAPSTPIKASSEPGAGVSKVFVPVFGPPLPPLMRAPTTVSPPGAPVYPQCLPRLSGPPSLIRPMITLTPPYGAASNQLRTLVQQLPPRPIVSQSPGAAVMTTAVSSVGSIVSPVTSFIAPLVTVTPPSMPVNLLSNSSPVVVGSQVLTPVSISMPGIAKGTVIYTNNPTLRFLLPSSGGMQTFTPNKPVTATPPKDSADITTSSSPITSTSEASVTVTSKFLVQKPPLVVNMRGKSLCSLILQVGKAETGQFVKLVDSDTDPDPEPDPDPDPVVEEPFTEESTEKTTDAKELSSTEAKGDQQTGDDQPMETKSTQEASENIVGDSLPANADSAQYQPTQPEDTAASDATTAMDSNFEKPSLEPGTDSETSGLELAALVTPVVDSVMKPIVAPDSDSTKDAADTERPSADSTLLNKESARPEDKSVATESTQQQLIVDSKPEEPVLPTNPTPVEPSDLLKDTKSVSDSKEAAEAPLAGGEQNEFMESPEKESPILGPFSPIFTEEELIDWDRESVSSNDNEEEYRPESPIILCAQEFPDGYTRLRSTALSNRGAELSCPRGNCARVSCYRRPVADLYADQEHAYSSPRSRQRFKQAGRKRMMTLLPPKRAYHRLQGSCDAFSNIFDYLSTADLLRASRVCRMWRKLASQPHQWATVRLKGLKVNSWKTCAKNLEFYGTTMLDMNGFDQSTISWHQFLSHVHHLRKLQVLVFGIVPAWVLHSVAISLPQLLCLEAEYIDVASLPPASVQKMGNASKSKFGEEHVVKLDVGWWASLPHLTVLRVRAPRGMNPAPFTPQGNFKALGTLASLTHLSLTSLRTFPCKEVEFLEHLPQLQVLELGQCKDWNDQTYQRLGKLRSLRRLRLELGGAQGDRGLANALGHMAKLEELTLLSFKITTSLAASIRRLKHLWHLTVWPDMSSEGAMIVYNTLQAVRSLKKLMSFSWGIIFTESPKTRYSKKSTKHREAQDVNEWWSKELRNVHRAKSIKIPLLKAFSDETSKSKSGAAAAPNNNMEQGLIGVGHLKHKLTKCLPDVEIYVYQVPETLLANVYGVTR